MSAPNSSARSSSPGHVGVVEDQRVQVAVAGVEDVGDAQAVAARTSPACARARRPSWLARDGAVHAQIVGREAAGGGEGVLAAGPEGQALGLALGDLAVGAAVLAGDRCRRRRSGGRPRPPGRRARRSAATRRRAGSRRAQKSSAALMAGWSIISSPPGMMPAAMIEATQSPPCSTEGKPISTARAVSGFCRMRTVTSVTTPSRPSEPVIRPSRS